MKPAEPSGSGRIRVSRCTGSIWDRTMTTTGPAVGRSCFPTTHLVSSRGDISQTTASGGASRGSGSRSRPHPRRSPFDLRAAAW